MYKYISKLLLDFTISNQNKETDLDHYLFLPDDWVHIRVSLSRLDFPNFFDELLSTQKPIFLRFLKHR